MAIFNKKEDLQHEAAKASKEAISAIISKEMTVTGEINFKGKARIDGTIEGDINGEYLVLSESGKIKGDIVLESLVCHGTIEGNVKSKLVTAQSTAVIVGKLESANLTVESGAVLEGEIKSSSRSSEGAKPQTAQAPKMSSVSVKTGRRILHFDQAVKFDFENSRNNRL